MFLSTRWGIPRKQLQCMMDSEEFVEQIAYYNLRPWGDDWLQSGIIAAAAASHPRLKRQPRVEHFMPKMHRPRMSNNEIAASLAPLVAMAKKNAGQRK